MGKLTVAGITYDNPLQQDQASLKFATNIQPFNNVVPGGAWQPNFAVAIPQPTTYEPQTIEPLSNPILVNQQPKPLTSPGIQIPGTTVVFRNPA